MGGSMPRRSWTTSEVRFLKKWAGRISANEICEALGRSKASVQSKVCELRKGGEGVSLRHYESVLVWCPNCATWRTKVFKGTGLCLVCRLRSRVDRCRRRCEEALLELPDEARAEFLSKQFKRGSIIPPKPKMKKADGSSEYERRRCEEENAVAIEEWEVSYLRRMANAEKARLYRIREKAKGAEKEAAAIAQMVTPDENGIR